MSLSFPLASNLTLQAIQTPKSIPFSRITPNLTTITTTSSTIFSSPQCKSLSSSSTKALLPHAMTSSGNQGGTAAETLSDDEQYKLEREVILQKLEILEGNFRDLESSSELEGILKDSYALGKQVLELESKTSTQKISTSSTEIFETILQQFHQALLRSEDGLVTVNPTPNPGPTAEMIDQMVRQTVEAYYHTDPPSLLQIEGNYAPIRKETPPTNALPVINGQIPEDINGMYLRVGPDPVFDPEANYKWMDGDGMVHGVRVENGSAYYVSRYVVNSRYLQEKAFGKAKFFKYGDLEGAYGLFVAFIQMLRARLNVLDMSYGYTTSNVGIVYHAGRVMALEDFGKPYVLSVTGNGDLETLGMNDYNGNLDHNFTPHPKKDPVTGEMFIVALSHTAPYATYRVVSKDGVLRNAVPITVSDPTYLHDLAITENYAVIMDNPFVFSPERMMTRDKWVFNFDASKKSRFGLLPRYAADERDIKWFEFEKPFFVFHTACAWEEDGGNKVIMYACSLEPSYNARTGDFDILPLPFRNFNNIKTRTGDPVELTLPEMYKFTFNMSTGEATKEFVPTFANAYVDQPKINEDYMARKCRYVYVTRYDDEAIPRGIIKFDLETGHHIALGGSNDITFSEHVFVPKQSPTAEDDGYLLCIGHYESINSGVLFVMDGRTMVVLATILINERVPYGFHSIFVSKEELDNQVKTL